jgi:hypothetical protein
MIDTRSVAPPILGDCKIISKECPSSKKEKGKK